MVELIQGKTKKGEVNTLQTKLKQLPNQYQSILRKDLERILPSSFYSAVERKLMRAGDTSQR